MKRKSLLVGIAFLTVASLFSPFAAVAADAPPAGKTEAAPPPPPPYLDEKITKLDGSGDVVLKQLLTKEKNMFVFFQSACAACQSELKALKEAYEKDPGANVIGIGVDTRKDALVAFVNNIGFPKVVFWDPDFSIAPKLSIYSTPGVAILGKDGKYIDRFLGFTPDTIGKIKAKMK